MGYHVRLIHDIDFSIVHSSVETITTLSKYSPVLAIVTVNEHDNQVSLRRMLQGRNAYGCNLISKSFGNIMTAHHSQSAGIVSVVSALAHYNIPTMFVTNREYSNYAMDRDRYLVDVPHTTYYFNVVEDYGSLERLSQHDE